MKIAVIGSGNIGSAFVRGLLREGSISPDNIFMTDISSEALAPFAEKGINTMQNNVEAVKNAELILFCVKPYLISNVIEEILPALSKDTVLVSLAAGIDFTQLYCYISFSSQPLFRAIPNTAMSVCQSMTCIAASAHATESQRDTVINLFSRVGKVLLINESLIDAATVLASCGTAFALRYLRAATNAGTETGFRPDVAQELITQTMLGAAVLIAESGNNPEAEIDRVTTPGGITIKGLNEMEHAGFSSAVMKGILAAYEKIKKKP